MSSVPKIAIIGAGPAGLTLARLLLVSKVKVDTTIYELDASPTARGGQGGTLDLHTHDGLAAIKKCGIWDAFQKYARYDGEEMIMADKNATELVHVRGGNDRPEIDRERLREILLEGVPEKHVKWGRKLKEVTEDGLLCFDGQEKMEGPFDLVVGGDGAWSKVRGKLTTLTPSYAGVSGYELVIEEPAKTCPRINKMAGRGSLLGSSERKFLNCQRMGNDSIKVRSWYVCPEGEAEQTIAKFGKPKTLEIILARYNGWAPEMTELLTAADVNTMRHWTLYELPVGSKWEHKKGFTLLGDAASLATPFSGEGVNKAMKDSLDLAELIVKSQDPNEDLTLDDAVLQYEQKMFPRAEKMQSTTIFNKQTWFGPTAPLGAISGIVKKMANEAESIPLKAVIVPPAVGLLYGYLWIRQQIGWVIRSFWRRT